MISVERTWAAGAGELGHSPKEERALAETWRQLRVPDICERMIGFSIPKDDTLLVVSYEGMHLVRLGQPVAVETDTEYAEYDLFDHQTGVSCYLGKEWNIIGLYPGHPILTAPDGEQLVLNPEGKTISVLKGGREVWSSAFENFSGDWVAATFSPDGRCIILGCPYDFDFRVWVRAAEDEQNIPPEGGGIARNRGS